MPLNAVVELPDSDRAELARWLRAPSMPAELAQRARIVLPAADGIGTNEIVTRTGRLCHQRDWGRRAGCAGRGPPSDRAVLGQPGIL
jgi:hypothetical protein